MTKKIHIVIEGETHLVDENQNVLQACLSLGLDLPYFCWHPSLGSVGACRQCAVVRYCNEEDTTGALIMSCMTPVSEGMLLSLQTQRAETFRSTNIEALMTNHPHDCPVCEEGGDCHLQDMTLLSRHTDRRYNGLKRTHHNQYLGPLLNHEMNRCIGCYRCVRFYRDYCGGTDLNVFASKSHVYFGRIESGDLENPFSGNLAEVCPTGVFTDKPFSQQYTRKWDLQSAPSVCTHCSVGCNTYPSERNGSLRKISNRFNPDINGHFLCDRGRFGHEHANHQQRLEKPLLRNNEKQTTDVLSAEQAEKLLHLWLTAKPQGIIAVGSGRSLLENNSALLKLVGPDDFFVGCSETELLMLQKLVHYYQHTPLTPCSLSEIETCDATLLIGEDITHTAPRVALSIRQMVRNAALNKAAGFGIKHWQDEAVRNIAQDLRSPLYIISAFSTDLADISTQSLNLPPKKQLKLLLEIEHYLKHYIKNTITNDFTHNDENNTHSLSSSTQAKEIAKTLLLAKRPLIITGTSHQHPELLEAGLRIALQLTNHKKSTRFYCATPQANSMAQALIGTTYNTDPIQSLTAFIDRLKTDPPTTLLVMETDLYRYIPFQQLDPLLDNVQHIIVLDQLLTTTAQMADLLLPTPSFAESSGTWVNNEGRAQYAFSAMPAIQQRKQSWQWLQELTELHQPEQILEWLAENNGNFSPLATLIDALEQLKQSDFPIARHSFRSTGRTALHADKDVKEYPPAQDELSPLVYSMEGVIPIRQIQQEELVTAPTGVWSPKWNSGQAINKQLETSETNKPPFPDVKLFTVNISASTRVFPSPDSLPKLKPIDPEGLIFEVASKSNIYADDELAAYSKPLQELAQKTNLDFVLINTNQAKVLKITTGDTVEIHGNNTSLSLKCQPSHLPDENTLILPFKHHQQLGQVSCILILNSKSQATEQGAKDD